MEISDVQEEQHNEQFEAVIKAYKRHYPKDFLSRLNVMGTMLYLIKDFKDQSVTLNEDDSITFDLDVSSKICFEMV